MVLNIENMEKLNYRIRMGLAGLWAGIVTILVFFISLVTWGRTFSGWLYARMLYRLGMPILGIKVQVTGWENLPTEPSVILINHQSNLDAFYLGGIYPKNTVVLAKREMMKVPLFGLILKASRTVLVDREDAAGARQAIQASSRAIKKDKLHLWIFPEGTRSQGKGLGEFKKGAFVMAIAAQAPIVPIVNQPIEHLLNPREKTLKSGVHHVKILPPIATKGLRMRDADELTEQVASLFQKEIQDFPTDS